MHGHGEKLTRKQEAAIAALLGAPSIRKAATEVGVTEKTLRTWLALPAFKAEYRAARRRLVESAVGLLQRGMGAAVKALLRAIKCGDKSIEVRAALGLLAQAMKGTEFVDLADEIAEIKATLESRGLKP